MTVESQKHFLRLLYLAVLNQPPWRLRKQEENEQHATDHRPLPEDCQYLAFDKYTGTKIMSWRTTHVYTATLQYVPAALIRFNATLPINCPIVNQNVYALIRNPLNCVGAISDRYTGTVHCSIPTPMPLNSFAISHA